MSGNQGQGHWNEKSASPEPSGASGLVGLDSGGKSDGRAGTSGDDGVDEEEQEEPSSSSSTEEDPLMSFREQWHRELDVPNKLTDTALSKNIQKAGPDTVEEQSEAQSIENKAKSFFVQGIEHEQNGKLYEAIQFYRRAVQLVPDIEFRLYETSKAKHRDYVETRNEESDDIPTCHESHSDSESEDGSDLMTRLQKYFNRSCFVCTPLEEKNTTHFSVLPMEIVLYILRWVVSADLDLRSLEICSQVCRGFYICSRDPEIWRLACARVWGLNCGGLTNYDSWRQMFIERPRLHFSGCYISKTTYVRQGENSFQDQFYRPWHLVEYYRYLRFFPEGLVLMMTTSEDPQASLAQLKQRSSRNSAILSGHYRLVDNKVVLVLRKQDVPGKIAGNNRYRSKKRDNIMQQDLGEQTFHIELQIHNYRRRIHAQLVWVAYTITKRRGGQEISTNLDLPTSRYPPFWFSRVKSYAAESETQLQ